MARPGPIYYGDPVERAHPLNRGLVSWWLPLPWYSSGPRLIDIAGRNHGTLTNGPTWTAGRNGFGVVKFDGTDDYVDLGSSVQFLSTTTPFTAEFDVFMGDTNTRTIGTFNAGGFGVNFSYVNFGSNYQGWALGDASWNPQQDSRTGRGNARYHVVFTYSGAGTSSASNYQIYENAQPGTVVNAGDYGSQPAVNRLGYHVTSSYTWLGTIYLARFYNRALSASEVALLYDQCLRGHPDTLRRLSTRAYSFGPPAATTAVDGSASLVLSGTATLTGTGALAGTAVLTLAGSAPLTGAGELAGSASLATAGSATLTGAGELASTASLTLAGSAALAGTGTLAGASTLTLSGSGTATGDGVLVGAASLTLAGSATLTGTGELAGAAALALDATGSMAAPGALVGTASLALTGAATLTGAGALAGDPALTLGATATLAGAGALAGTAPLTLTGTATLAGTGALAGSAGLVLEGTGTLTSSTAPLAGTVGLALSATATLVGTAPLAGTASLTVSASLAYTPPTTDHRTLPTLALSSDRPTLGLAAGWPTLALSGRPTLSLAREESMAVHQDLMLFKGEDARIPLASVGGESITGTAFRFVAGELGAAAASLSVAATFSGTSGYVDLPSASTDALTAATEYHYQFRRTDSGSREVLAYGRLEVQDRPAPW